MSLGYYVRLNSGCVRMRMRTLCVRMRRHAYARTYAHAYARAYFFFKRTFKKNCFLPNPKSIFCETLSRPIFVFLPPFPKRKKSFSGTLFDFPVRQSRSGAPPPPFPEEVCYSRTPTLGNMLQWDSIPPPPPCPRKHATV